MQIQKTIKSNTSIYSGGLRGLIYILLIVVLSGLVVGCGGKKRTGEGSDADGAQSDSGNGTAGETPADSEPAKLKFADIKDILQARCAMCHNANSGPAIINILEYAVIKKTVDSGSLYERVWTLKDSPSIQKMPPGDVEMPEEERKRIVKWIEDGGLN